MPAVSIIIPIYNAEQYIERCAISLFEQSFKDIEYIFVNDATPDSSMKILAKIIANYPDKNARIINHNTNGGAAKARETGLLAAQGDYITFVDSDDWIEKDYCHSLYETAISSNADITCCGYRMTDGKNFWKEDCYNDSIYNETSGILRTTIALKSSPYLCTKLFNKRLFSNNIVHPTHFYADDWVLLVQLSYYAQTTAFVDKPLYNYYYNSSNIHRQETTTASVKRCNDQAENIRLICEWLKVKGIVKDYSSEIVRIKTRPKAQLVHCLNDKECRQLWIKTFPEVNIKLLFNRYVRKDLKIIHLAVLTGMYVPIKRIKAIF